ncbi:MAG: methionine--tRNA ligase subunit beta [Nanoarchaeota archaeon]
MKPEITYKDFAKLDMIIGQIIEIKEIEGADKLWKLKVNIGNEERIVCAGLKEHYSKEELQDKKVILLSNLAPRKIKGIESQGMILASVSEDHKQVKIIEPNGEIGWKIS